MDAKHEEEQEVLRDPIMAQGGTGPTRGGDAPQLHREENRIPEGVTMRTARMGLRVGQPEHTPFVSGDPIPFSRLACPTTRVSQSSAQNMEVADNAASEPGDSE